MKFTCIKLAISSSDISVCSIALVVSQSNEQEINVGKSISIYFVSTK